MKKNYDLPVMDFASQAVWEGWMKENHASSKGVMMKIAKKASGKTSVTYAEALEIALCYGWIDSRKEAYDDQYYLQRFTPRGPRSIWSKINREKAEKLIQEGRMLPEGQKAVDQAKKNGRWDAAYAPQSNKEIPTDFKAALKKSPKAEAFFETLNSVNRFAIIFRIGNVKKEETRQRKIAQFIAMLEKGEKIYP